MNVEQFQPETLPPLLGIVPDQSVDIHAHQEDDCEDEEKMAVGSANAYRDDADDDVKQLSGCAVGALTSNEEDLVLGCLWRRLGQHEEALRLHFACVESAQAAQEGQHALLELGTTYMYQARHADAISCYRKCLQEAERLGDLAAQEVAHVKLSDAHNSMGSYNEALEHNRLSLKISLKTGGVVGGQGPPAPSFFAEYWKSGRGKDAFQGRLSMQRRAVINMRLEGDLSLEGRACFALADTLKACGNLTEAAEMFVRCRDLAVRTRNAVQQIDADLSLGDILMIRCVIFDALKVFRDALQEATETRDLVRQSAALNRIGAAYTSVGQGFKACLQHEKALKCAAQAVDLREMCLGHLGIGDAYESMHFRYAALVHFEESLALAQQLKDLTLLCKAYLGLGKVTGKIARQINFACDDDPEGKNVCMNMRIPRTFDSIELVEKALDISFFLLDENLQRVCITCLALARSDICVNSEGFDGLEDLCIFPSIASHQGLREADALLALGQLYLRRFYETDVCGLPSLGDIERENTLEMSLLALSASLEINQGVEVQFGESDGILLFEQQHAVYGVLIQVLLAFGEEELALVIAERSKCRTLSRIMLQNVSKLNRTSALRTDKWPSAPDMACAESKVAQQADLVSEKACTGTLSESEKRRQDNDFEEACGSVLACADGKIAQDGDPAIRKACAERECKPEESQGDKRIGSKGRSQEADAAVGAESNTSSVRNKLQQGYQGVRTFVPGSGFQGPEIKLGEGNNSAFVLDKLLREWKEVQELMSAEEWDVLVEFFVLDDSSLVVWAMSPAGAIQTETVYLPDCGVQSLVDLLEQTRVALGLQGRFALARDAQQTSSYAHAQIDRHDRFLKAYVAFYECEDNFRRSFPQERYQDWCDRVRKGASEMIESEAEVLHEITEDPQLLQSLQAGLAQHRQVRSWLGRLRARDGGACATSAINVVLRQTDVLSWELVRSLTKVSLEQDYGVNDRASCEALVRQVEVLFDEQRLLRVLYQVLIQPIEGLLVGQDLVIIPHMDLYTVPWAALLDSHNSHLVEKCAIRLVPSLEVMHQAAKRSQPSEAGQAKLAVIGNPWPVLAGCPSLTNAEEEAAVVGVTLQQMYEGDGVVQTALGRAATKQKTLAMLDGASWCHIACHGLLEEQALVFAKSDNDNGLMTAGEIQSSLVLASGSTVVLSACNTGMGHVCAEGVLGLARAFLAARAACTVVTLWSIDDANTKKLMKAFYAALESGLCVPRALQMAMLFMLGKEFSPSADPHDCTPVQLAASTAPECIAKKLEQEQAFEGGAAEVLLARRQEKEQCVVEQQESEDVGDDEALRSFLNLQGKAEKAALELLLGSEMLFDGVPVGVGNGLTPHGMLTRNACKRLVGVWSYKNEVWGRSGAVAGLIGKATDVCLKRALKELQDSMEMRRREAAKRGGGNNDHKIMLAGLQETEEMIEEALAEKRHSCDTAEGKAEMTALQLLFNDGKEFLYLNSPLSAGCGIGEGGRLNADVLHILFSVTSYVALWGKDGRAVQKAKSLSVCDQSLTAALQNLRDSVRIRKLLENENALSHLLKQSVSAMELELARRALHSMNLDEFREEMRTAQNGDEAVARGAKPKASRVRVPTFHWAGFIVVGCNAMLPAKSSEQRRTQAAPKLTVQDVRRILCENGLSLYADKFEECSVDGTLLPDLHLFWEDLGVDNRVHRHKILKLFQG